MSLVRAALVVGSLSVLASGCPTPSDTPDAARENVDAFVPDGVDAPMPSDTGSAPSGPRLVSLAAGENTSCAVLEDGTARCWGRGDAGQLGNGTTDSSVRPVEVSGLTDAIAISTGYEIACALRSGGTVMCWGGGFNGRLGNGAEDDSPVPVAVTGLDSVTQIRAGYSTVCALRDDGTVWCWGRGGELGAGVVLRGLQGSQRERGAERLPPLGHVEREGLGDVFARVEGRGRVAQELAEKAREVTDGVALGARVGAAPRGAELVQQGLHVGVLPLGALRVDEHGHRDHEPVDGLHHAEPGLVKASVDVAHRASTLRSECSRDDLSPRGPVVARRPSPKGERGTRNAVRAWRATVDLSPRGPVVARRPSPNGERGTWDRRVTRSSQSTVAPSQDTRTTVPRSPSGEGR